MIGAYLYPQLQNMDRINQKRLDIWQEYDEFFRQFDGIIQRPFIPDNCVHNAHMYYVLFKNLNLRTKFINFMKENEISTVFHYIPLHSSPAGIKYCKTFGDMSNTDKTSDTLVRMPLFYNLSKEDMTAIKNTISEFMEKL